MALQITGQNYQRQDGDLDNIAALATTVYGRSTLELADIAGALTYFGAEPAIGNPGTTGFLLSRSTTGTNTWVDPSTLGGGGGGSPLDQSGFNAFLGTATYPGGYTLDGSGNIGTPGGIIASGSITGSNLSGNNYGDQTTVSGNAGTATALATARNINGVAFDGTAPITVTADANTLTGTQLKSTVVTTSITSTGTLTGGATGAGFTVAFGSSTFSGTIPSANIPTATNSVLGGVKIDGTTITISSGVISGTQPVVGTANQINVSSNTLTLSSTLVIPGTLAMAGIATFAQTALATTPAPAIILSNTTPAAVGAQQVSPSLQWTGQGWKTVSTAASQTVDFRAYLLPVQSTTNPTATWVLQSQINGGGWTDRLTVTSGGALATAGTITGGLSMNLTNSTSTYTAGASGFFILNGRSKIGSSADGTLNFLNNAGADSSITCAAITLGAGTAISKSSTFTLAVSASIAAGAVSSQDITATGIVAGDTCSAVEMTAIQPDAIVVKSQRCGTDKITVDFLNTDLLASHSLTGTIKVRSFKA